MIAGRTKAPTQPIHGTGSDRGRETSGFGRRVKVPGGRVGLIRECLPNGRRLIVALVTRTTQLIKPSCRLLTRWGAQNRLKVAPKRLMLAGPVARPVAVRREQCFPDIVRRIVRDVVSHGITSKEAQLFDPVICLGHKRRSPPGIDRNLIDSARVKKRRHGGDLRVA